MNFLSRWFGKRDDAKNIPSSPLTMTQEEDCVTPMPPGTGWRPWVMGVKGEFPFDIPYCHDKIETWYQWAPDRAPVLESPMAIHPSRNVNGLWWRPVR